MRSEGSAGLPVADRNRTDALSPAADLNFAAADAAITSNHKEAVDKARTFRAEFSQVNRGRLSRSLSRAHIAAAFPGLSNSHPIGLLPSSFQSGEPMGPKLRLLHHGGEAG